MIINHNISSLNTYGKLNTNNTNSSKSLEKLSSGLRINKAGDDAAGLSISEKMRAQIRGLDQATANSQDGISLIQTAEGGLSETHSILQRMRELAVQSATDTNTNDDRAKIQSEVDQLAKEITRISNTTEFNTQNLLAGGLQDTFHIGANAGQNLSMSINSMDAQSLGVAGAQKSINTFAGVAAGINSASNASRGLAATSYLVTVTTAGANVTAVNTDIVTKSGNTSKLAVATAAYSGTSDKVYTVKVDSVSGAATTNTVTAIKYSTDGGTSWSTYTGDMTAGATIDGMTFTMAASAGQAYQKNDQYSFTATAEKATLTLRTSTGVNIGATQTVHKGDTKVTLGDGNVGKTVDMGFDFTSLIGGAGVATTASFVVADTKSTAAVVNDGIVNSDAVAAVGINVSDQTSANSAITTIDNAIKTVSVERSKLGAYQNRLEHTIANLGTSSENMTAAESRIRDVDMAKEMMSFQKNQILSQAATSMLAQANQQPQNVLKLLG